MGKMVITIAESETVTCSYSSPCSFTNIAKGKPESSAFLCGRIGNGRQVQGVLGYKRVI
jgi:hypothetical protein